MLRIMTRSYAFNGDADGLCALQQLRLAGASAAERAATLITGVKRDIALLGRVERGGRGDDCTVLDISLDVNRAGLLALLETGVAGPLLRSPLRWRHPAGREAGAHIDLQPERVHEHARRSVPGTDVQGAGRSPAPSATACPTRGGRWPGGRALRRRRPSAAQELGVAVNYNAYGETIADLHVPPVELADEMLGLRRPAGVRRRVGRVPQAGRRLSRRHGAGAPARAVAPGPGRDRLSAAGPAWARRASGTLANDLAKANAGSAVAIVSSKTDGGYLVSVRVPRDGTTSAEEFCREFPTGGGRRTAAGINNLPAEALNDFVTAFEGVRRLTPTNEHDACENGRGLPRVAEDLRREGDPAVSCRAVRRGADGRGDRDGARQPVLSAAGQDARQPAHRAGRQPADRDHVPAALPLRRGVRRGHGAVPDALPVAAAPEAFCGRCCPCSRRSARPSSTRPTPTRPA